MLLNDIAVSGLVPILSGAVTLTTAVVSQVVMYKYVVASLSEKLEDLTGAVKTLAGVVQELSVKIAVHDQRLVTLERDVQQSRVQ